MSTKGNRFGISVTEIQTNPNARRNHEAGPMAVAVRETATSAQEASENLVEQRYQNAPDAKELRAARSD